MSFRSPEPDPPSLRALERLAITQAIIVVVGLSLITLLVADVDSDDFPPVWFLLALVALVVLGGVAAERIGFTAEPLGASPDEAAQFAEAFRIYQARMLVRLALTEGVLLIVVLSAFLFDYGAWPIVLAGLPGLAVMAFELWPSVRNVDKIATALETDGHPSYLLEKLI